MDWLKNIFYPFRERVRSPIYGTFIVSWLLWNWRIVISVLFLNYHDRNHLNIVEFIIEEANWCNYFLMPIILSVFYLFVIPELELALLKVTEKNKRRKLDRKYEILGKYTVSGKRYNELYSSYEKEKERLVKIEDSNKSLEQSLTNLEEINKDQERLLEQKKEIERKFNLLSQRRNNAQYFIGRWNRTEFNPDNSVNILEEFDISDRVLFKLVGGRRDNHSTVIMFDYDLINSSLNMSRTTVGKNEQPNFDSAWLGSFRIINENKFEGSENGKRVYWEKQFPKESDASIKLETYSKYDDQIPGSVKDVLSSNKTLNLQPPQIEKIIKALFSSKLNFKSQKEISLDSDISEIQLGEILNFLQDMGLTERRVTDDGTDTWRIPAHPVKIYSASYGIEKKLVDVTFQIQRFVAEGIYKGTVSPLTFKVDDPAFGSTKTLKIHCRILGVERELSFLDGQEFEIL